MTVGSNPTEEPAVARAPDAPAPDAPAPEAAAPVATKPSPEPIRPARPATDSIADGIRTRTTYAVSLDMFEGPLDLLLHLVRRHELDILDIPIAFITEKYIEYITFARSLDIEVAGEYLLMAATLAFLKSRELLPTVAGEDEEAGEDEDDGVDPREELIRRLIEYERFREAGDELGSRPLFGRDVFPRGGDPDVILPEPGLAPVTLFRLAEAYNRVLDRAKIRQEHEVVIEAVTVRQRMRQLGLMLSREPKISFEGLFLNQSWASEKELRQMLVVTLMSILEMAKIGVLGVYQAHGSDSLELERVVDVAEMAEAISVFREEGEEDLPLDDEPGEGEGDELGELDELASLGLAGASLGLEAPVVDGLAAGLEAVESGAAEREATERAPTEQEAAELEDEAVEAEAVEAEAVEPEAVEPVSELVEFEHAAAEAVPEAGVGEAAELETEAVEPMAADELEAAEPVATEPADVTDTDLVEAAADTRPTEPIGAEPVEAEAEDAAETDLVSSSDAPTESPTAADALDPTDEGSSDAPEAETE